MCPDVNRGKHSGCGTEHDVEGDDSEKKGEMNEGRVKMKLRQTKGEWKARGTRNRGSVVPRVNEQRVYTSPSDVLGKPINKRRVNQGRGASANTKTVR